jgi:hypothetical protein
MSYSIILTNGTTLTSVVNGTIDQTATDLTLIGQNTTGYGLFVNDNFVHLLENFANSSQPNHPIVGQLWFDTSENTLKVYNGNSFTPTGNTVVSDTAPSSLATGGLWINNKTSQMFFNDGIETTLAGPIYTKTQGPSGFVIEDVLDAVGGNHTIAKLMLGNTLLGIFAKETFTPAPPGISGFSSSATVIGHQDGTILTVTQVVAGTLSVGQTISGVGITSGTVITEFLQGPGGQGNAQGGVGTYYVSTSATVGSTTISAIYGTLQIGFNVSTYGGIKFNVPVSQANTLLADDGSLKSSNDFVSTRDSSATIGTLSIQNETPLILGSAGQTYVNVNSNIFEIATNPQASNQNFQLTVNPGGSPSPALFINGTTLKTGIATITPLATLDVNGSLRVAPNTPTSNSDIGVPGQICWDDSWIYVCTDANTWKRAALSTW